jgi:tetratricopeptide (TPR) repeat protein
MKKFINKFSVLALVIALTLLACLSVSNNSSVNPENIAQKLTFQQPKSSIGAYLAGQHAARNNDYSKASAYFLESIEAKNESSVLDEQVLDLLVATGKYDDAIRLAQKIREQADSPTAGLLLYADKMHNEDYSGALEILDSLTEESKKTVIHQILQAWALLGEDKKAEAMQIMKKLEKTKYFTILINYNHALIAEITGENKLAVDLYKELLANKKVGTKIAENAYRFFKKTHNQEALKAIPLGKNERNKFNTSLPQPTINVGAADALNEVATMLIAEQNFAKSSVFFRLGLYISPKNEEALMLLGTILAHERDFDSANKIFATIPENSEFYEEAKILRAQNYAEMNNKIAAKNLLKELTENNDTKIEALMTLGDLARQDEDFSLANDYYTQAIQAIKSKKNQRVFWPIYFARAVTFERMKKWDEAEIDFKSALKLEPKQPDVLNYYAYSLLDMNMSERYDEALEMLQIAYNQRPNDAHILDSIGWAWYKKNDYKKAVSHLEDAATNMPYDPTINEHLGDVYWQLGRETEAQYAWERALANKPEERFVEQLKYKLLNGLENKPQNKTELEIGNSNELSDDDSSTR